MKPLFSRLVLSAAFLAASSLTLGQTALAQSNKPFPMEYWAVGDLMSSVSLSPSGNRIAFMKKPSKKSDPIIEVYETSNLGSNAHRVGSDKMEITSFDWLSDDVMIISFRDQVRKRIEGFNQGAYKAKIATYDVNTKKFRELNSDSNESFQSMSLVNILPDSPDEVLVQFADFERGKSFEMPNYYRYNVKTGSKSLVLRGNPEYRGVRFDAQGEPRFSNGFDQSKQDYVYYYRKPGGSGWTEYYRQNENSFDEFSYAGLVKGDDSRIYVLANNGHDRAGLWKFNLDTKSFENLVYRPDRVNAYGTVRHSNEWTNPNEVTGVFYLEDKVQRKFFDPVEEATYANFEKVLPEAHDVNIVGRSRDGGVAVIKNTGPKDPGTYYLYNKGKLSKVGSVNDLFDSKGLSKVEYISYPSRDGKTIYAYLTRPNGSGPFPLIVLPHGGPFISEYVNFDDWGQMLANRGYMVLQPEYRGSTNFGKDFYTTAFINGGEGGRQMQDDLDDGALYLANKGEVKRDKMAMFGWSYGGYAALIAAARSPNIYQCSIAGAAVADNNQQLNYYRGRIKSSGAPATEQIKMWSTSVNPIDEADKVNIPLFIIHGSIDQRVPIDHAKKYTDKLDKLGKPYKYLELKDADHFSNTLKYDHKMQMYPAMFDFLKNDCGM